MPGLENWAVVLADLGKAAAETALMVGVSLGLALAAGVPLGILLFVTGRGLFWENRVVNAAGGVLINLVRSLPFVILLILVLPLSRVLTGKTTGPVAAVVPLAIAAIAFYARLVVAALLEVDKGVIEAAQAFGAGPFTIVRRVLLPEALPGLLRGFTVTAVSLFGYSAMAGVVGGGGIGFLAINYGYYRYETAVMLVTAAVLLVIVQAVQAAGDAAAARADRK